MGKHGKILPEKDNLLVELRTGSPFTPEGEEPQLWTPDPASPKQKLRYWGVVVAAGPQVKQDTHRPGACVIFPPTAGFVIEGSPSDQDKQYRIITENAVVAVFDEEG